MNLTQAASLAKRFFWIIPVFLVSIFLVILIIFRFGPKTPAPDKTLTTPYFDTLPPKTTIIDDSQLEAAQEVPKSLPAYSIKPNDFLKNSQSLASSMGFPAEFQTLEDTKSGQGHLYIKEGASLIVYKEFFSYGESIGEIKTTIDTNNIPNLEQIARFFLAKLNLSSGQEQPSITYLTRAAEGLSKSKDPSRANLVTFNFPQTASNLPIIVHTGGIDVTIDPEGDVFRLVYQPILVTEELEEFPIINQTKALELLRSDKGSLIKIDSEDDNAYNALDLEQTSLNKAYLAYYVPSITITTIQPVWIFEGQSLFNELQIEVTFAVPAISSEFLK